MTTSEAAKTAGDWRGADLGTRTVSYTERDAILYALAVGAKATELDLVFEDQLRVLPTFALTLAQWAPDALGSAGAFDTSTALHGSQELKVLAPLPRSGDVTLKASVGEVWDKGAAARVRSEGGVRILRRDLVTFCPRCRWIRRRTWTLTSGGADRRAFV